MILDLRDQLGNQLFAYASIKSVCKELGQKFAFVTNDECLVNSSDKKYGFTIVGGAFPNIDLEENVSFDRIPPHNYREPAKRKTNFLPEVYRLGESDFILGHFQCEKYFYKYKEEVCHWFKLRDEIEREAESRIEEIKKSGKTVVSIHFRRQKDYVSQGRLIDYGYYVKAFDTLLQRIHKQKSDVVAVLFYDTDPGDWIKSTLGCQIYESHGSLFEDLALMKYCDHHIVSNSTFAWWGAWLDPKEGSLVFRPSIYPISFRKLYPDDIYPSHWIKIEAKRDYSMLLYLNGVLQEFLRFYVKKIFRKN